MKVFTAVAAACAVSAALMAPAQAQDKAKAPAAKKAAGAPMTFFVTSTGKGNGADLGGLEGADAHCNALAAAAGSKLTTWKAYLSTTMPGGEAGVNARDRIGKGPWQNVKGVVVAKSVDDLHTANVKINKETALTEKGGVVPSGGSDGSNTHDMLTGSDPMGMYSTAGGDTNCGNWTKSDGGSTIVGHHNRAGLGKTTRHMQSWNSAHGSRGCSPDQLKGSGGAGQFYCFAGQ